MEEKEKTMINFYQTKVKDIMLTTKSEIPRTEETTEVSQVLSLLKTHDHIWVTDSNEPTQLLGIITRSDTIAFFSPPLPSLQSFDSPDSRSLQFGIDLTAEEIMSKKPVTASPDETIRDLLVKMKEQKVKYLPVVDDYDQFIGEVSLNNIIQEYSRLFLEIQQKKRIELS
jgi:predicted transcriptional regulator